MGFEVLDLFDTEQRALWAAEWERSPNAEVFWHPAYMGLLLEPGARALLALYRSDRGVVVFPFFLRDLKGEAFCPRIDGPCTDLITPYGYGGPFCSAPTAVPAHDYWRQFDAWSEREGVVSEFLRFSLFREELISYPGDVQERQTNVVRTLDLSEEQLWQDFEHKVRKNVKRARNEGVTIATDEVGLQLEAFQRIYRGTMARRGAAQSYFFSDEFFRRLIVELAGHFVFFHAVVGGQIVSTELVLLSKRRLYSFLGGTDDRFFSVRPNDLLKFHAILWAKDSGREAYVLGGGYEGDDGILKYKQSFAPRGCLPFFVGSRVRRPDTYARLCAAKIRWSVERGRSISDARFFPMYRA
jgi:hypothetical protein